MARKKLTTKREFKRVFRRANHHYPEFLARFLNTKEGKMLTYDVMQQLIDGFIVSNKRKDMDVIIDDTATIYLEPEDYNSDADINDPYRKQRRSNYRYKGN